VDFELGRLPILANRLQSLSADNLIMLYGPKYLNHAGNYPYPPDFVICCLLLCDMQPYLNILPVAILGVPAQYYAIEGRGREKTIDTRIPKVDSKFGERCQILILFSVHFNESFVL
jgi:hypothetical protein